jgi:probable HAF family extracellular repeat protein
MRYGHLVSAKLLGAVAALCAEATVARVATAAPLYNIVDIGVIHVGDPASQGFRISPNGIVTGRNYGSPFPSNSQAYSWTQGGGLAALPVYVTTNPVRNFDVGNGVNNAGIVVGAGGTTASVANPLPLMWQGGVASQIPLPTGQTFGVANDINSSNVIVGSVNGGSSQIAFISSGGNSSVITTLTPAGARCVTAFSINDAGTAVGVGIDPNNAVRNVPFVYDSVYNTATEVPPLPGKDGGIAFDVSEAGQIVGTSTLGQGTGTAFYWSQTTGTVPIPLVNGTSSNSARGVNSNGWVVGNAGGAFSVPWLWDGTQSYRLQDLIPTDAGWDLSHNTSNAALGISESGVIVGTGVIGPDTHAFAMIPVVPEPTSLAGAAAAGLLPLIRRRSRRVASVARSRAGRAVCAAAVVGGAAAGTAVAGPITFETVIKSGDAVPGVPGATWNTTSNSFFSAPAIDNSGNVVFRGQMTAGVGGVQSTAPANQAGYWYGAPGALNLFARDGSGGPTLSNPNGWVHNSTTGLAGLAAFSPLIAPHGQMLTGSSLNGTGVTNNVNNTAAWTGTYNNMQLLAQRGVASGPQPSGTTHALWNSAMNNFVFQGWINNNGQTLLSSDLITDGNAATDVVAGATATSNDSGIWVASSAGNTLIAREGGATSIAGTIYGDMGLAANSGALNGSGQAAWVSTLRGGVGGVVGTGSTGRNDQVVWSTAVPGGQATAIARKGDPVPGLSGVNYASSASIAFFLGQQPFNNSGRMVFDAQFGTGAAAGTGNEAIMTSLNGNTNIVVRENTPAAGVAGATWNTFNSSNAKIRLNNNSSLVFTAGMSGTAGGTTDDEGIWMTKIDAGGNATSSQLIAREGQPIPNAAGLSLGGSLVAASTPILNNADQIVFQGIVTGSGVTTSNDQALFAWDPSTGLSLLLREGDDAATSITGLTGTIGNNTVTISPFSYGGMGNGEGGNVSLSDSGWLTLAVTLRGGAVTNDINIIRTQIPEPASVCLLGACGVAALRRRRRATH